MTTRMVGMQTSIEPVRSSFQKKTNLAVTTRMSRIISSLQVKNPSPETRKSELTWTES